MNVRSLKELFKLGQNSHEKRLPINVQKILKQGRQASEKISENHKTAVAVGAAYFLAGGILLGRAGANIAMRIFDAVGTVLTWAKDGLKNYVAPYIAQGFRNTLKALEKKYPDTYQRSLQAIEAVNNFLQPCIQPLKKQMQKFGVWLVPNNDEYKNMDPKDAPKKTLKVIGLFWGPTVGGTGLSLLLYKYPSSALGALYAANFIYGKTLKGMYFRAHGYVMAKNLELFKNTELYQDKLRPVGDRTLALIKDYDSWLENQATWYARLRGKVDSKQESVVRYAKRLADEAGPAFVGVMDEIFPIDESLDNHLGLVKGLKKKSDMSKKLDVASPFEGATNTPEVKDSINSSKNSQMQIDERPEIIP